MTVALCPGTFDPVHNGHLDIIARAARLFSTVIVGVAASSPKEPLFTQGERIEMLREATQGMGNVVVEGYDGLTVAFARAKGATVIVKGVRTASDLDYEARMAEMNRHLAPEVDTLFFLTAPHLGFLSSTLIKEVARLGGNVEGLVPPGVARRLWERFK